MLNLISNLINTKKNNSYRPEIDGLRAFSVLFVILYHLNVPLFDGGFLGVDIFFVISGYLISKLIFFEIKNKKFSLFNFYERRFRRIIPNLYFVILINIFVALMIFTPDKLISFSQSIIGNLFFVPNIVFWKQGGYFDLVNTAKPLFHTWSLGVEEQFYLIFPVFTILIFRFGFSLMSKIITFSFFLSLIFMIYYNELKPIFSFYMLPTRGWEIILGIIISLYEQSRLKKINNNNIKNLLCIIGVLLIIFSIIFISEQYIFPGLILLMPMTGVLFIILYCDKTTFIYKILSNNILVFFGLISYSLYLWHHPIIVYSHELEIKRNYLFFILFFIFLILISTFSWYFVEKNFRNFKRINTKYFYSILILSFIFLLTFANVIKSKRGNFKGLSDFQLEFYDRNSNDIYVWKNFKNNKINKENFEEVEILIIGDSFAADLFNILIENKKIKERKIKSFEIPVTCKNFAIDLILFENKISKKSLKNCKKINWYNGKNIISAIKNANIIFLSSNWSYDEHNLVLKTYNNLTKKYGNKSFIFGQKKISMDIENIDFNQKKIFVKKNEDGAKFNKKLKEVLNERFIDPYDLFCENNMCFLGETTKIPIIYDKTHLTSSGAKYISNKLFKNLEIDQFLK